MSNVNSAYNSKKCNALSACALCAGMFAHESWCASRDPQASYAYQIVFDVIQVNDRRLVDSPFVGCRVGGVCSHGDLGGND